jgi:hypothetical protein
MPGMDRYPILLQRAYFRFVRPLLYRRYRYLPQAVREWRAARILEVGVWNGMQAELTIREAQKVRGSEVEYHGFDFFEDTTPEKLSSALSSGKRPPSLEVVARRLSRTGARVHLYRGDTRETLPAAVPSLPLMDLIYIDGDHSVAGIASDWAHLQPLIGPGTLVLFDDYWNRTDAGCKSLVDSLDRGRYDVRVLPVTDRGSDGEHDITIQYARVRLRR